MEELLRYVMLVVLSIAVVTVAVGGLVTPVSGMWRDGDRIIELTQFLAFVRGTCKRPGGLETYQGVALFGFLRLSRMASGSEYLASLGFAPEAARLIVGQPMALLRFRVYRGELLGDFEGRHFSFDLAPPKLRRISKLEREPRHWQRVI